MKHFCTYFDSRYLSRGLALYESLARHCAPFRLSVLCMDEEVHDALTRLALPEVEAIPLADLEADDAELVAAKATRSRIEYYFTISPVLPLFLFRRHPNAESITYLDADLWFFDSIEPLFEELGDGAVGIIEHRFAARNAALVEWGRFNVGCLIFRNDPRAFAVLESWRSQCIAWCYDRLEGDRFADQKYLDRWPDAFEGVVVLRHDGANVAPWNAARYRLHERDGRVFVDDAPLLFHHFHRLRQWRPSLWQLGLAAYRTRPSRALRDLVYRPYIAALERLDTTSAAPARYQRRLTETLRTPLWLLTGELLRSRGAARRR